MPLSEQEQRLLEEMERSLYHNDADFVAAVSPRNGKPSYSAVVTGVLVAIGGVAVLVAGVAIRQPLIGVLGFLVMFAGVLLCVTPPRRLRTTRTRGSSSSGSASTGSKQSRPSFMQNLGDRWDKRQDDREQ